MQKSLWKVNGFVGLFVYVLLVITLFNITFTSGILTNITISLVVSLIGLIFLLNSTFILKPNEGIIGIFFGKYTGGLQESGFYFVNPFSSYIKFDLRLKNIETTKLKINDKDGSPLDISMVYSYLVKDMEKAAFNVSDLNQYIKQQIEAITRNLIKEHTFQEIVDQVEELSEKAVEKANKELSEIGIEFKSANLVNMSYAPEIAQAMLKKQQAKAIVEAKKELVKGVTGIIEELITDLESKDKSNDLSKEDKNKLMSNMLIVLLSDKDATPTIQLS